MGHPDKKSVPGREPETRSAGVETRQNLRQRDYTSFTDQSHSLTHKERAALWWLERDYFLLPVQPNAKRLVPGFGFYLDKITTPERVAQWFGPRSLANLAVCGTQTSFILDFDNPDLYRSWAGQFPDESRTYTERTPFGGYHVFAHAWPGDLKGIKLIKGVELKHTCLIYPSTIDNKPYRRGLGDMLKVSAKLCLSPLSERPITNDAPRAAPRDKTHLQKIKSAFLCLDQVQAAKPNIKVYQSANRFISLTCPFHDDDEPSFWIDTERNLWGCHACGIRGDAINLYARLKGMSNREAIQEMGKGL